jgi:predicted nucleic acid-binding protein
MLMCWSHGHGKIMSTMMLPCAGLRRLNGSAETNCSRPRGLVTIQEASETLKGMLASLSPRHSFLPDDQPSVSFANWCDSASRTMDAHLLQLAQAHQAKLVTLDAGIPGAFLIPMS